MTTRHPADGDGREWGWPSEADGYGYPEAFPEAGPDAWGDAGAATGAGASFEAAVQSLSDPLTDPLPGQRAPTPTAPDAPGELGEYGEYGAGGAWGGADEYPGYAGYAAYDGTDPARAGEAPATGPDWGEWPEPQEWAGGDGWDGAADGPGPWQGPEWRDRTVGLATRRDRDAAATPAGDPAAEPDPNDETVGLRRAEPASDRTTAGTGTAAGFDTDTDSGGTGGAGGRRRDARHRGTRDRDARHRGTRDRGTRDRDANSRDGTDRDGKADDTTSSAAGTPASGGRAARRRAASATTTGRGRRRAAPSRSPGRRRAKGSAPPPVPEPPPNAGRAARRRAAKAAAKAARQTGTAISNVIGELFITTGVLLLLFVVYQVWWTNYEAKAHADRERRELQEQWEQSEGGGSRDPGVFSPGEGFAVLYLPTLDVVVPIAETTDEKSVLDNGMVGHYSEEDGLPTAMPWDETGNVGLAGHRNTHGEPFRYINKLEPGDPIIIETQDTFYTYEMADRLDSTSPSNVDVLDPVPPDSKFTEPGRYVTLTTCTPEFTSTYRLIVWGEMVEERPREEGLPDALVE